MEAMGFRKQLTSLSRNPFYVAVYLQCIMQQAQSPVPVSTTVYSIDWAHSLAGLSKMPEHPLVSSMFSASKRILGKPKTRKEPITPEMLQDLVTKFKDDSSLYGLRTVALCLIGFTGFFRFSGLCGIRACDVKLFPSYISIFLETSKTVSYEKVPGSRSLELAVRRVL